MRKILAIAILGVVAIIFILPQVDLEPTVLRFEQLLCSLWIAAFLCVLTIIAFSMSRCVIFVCAARFYSSLCAYCPLLALRC